MSQLCNKARNIVKEMDKKNDLTCIRVQSSKYEVGDIVVNYKWDIPFHDYLLLYSALKGI